MPNFSMTFGYTNSSWTLKADMVAEYCCRLINYMDRKKLQYCVPDAKPEDISDQPFLDLQSGYVARARDLLPRQGTGGPWKVVQNYFHDIPLLRYSRINDGRLTFGTTSRAKATAQPANQS